MASRGGWDFDTAVIGGGPGGLVSALYLRRFQRSVALIQHGRPRASWIPCTHNLIGYPNGISGQQLLHNLGRQLSDLGLERIEAQAVVHPVWGGFSVETGQGQIRARTVILATGIEDKQPVIDNIPDLRERGLLRYCSICDGFEFRKTTIAVLAKDDLGLQKGLFLCSWTHDIIVIVPEDFRPAPQRVRELDRNGVRLAYCKTLRLEHSGGDAGVWVFLDQQKPFLVRAVYVELGCVVNDSAFGHLRRLRRSKEGFLLTTTEQRLGIPGLFAVGDCVNILGQISVAAGQAAIAATAAHNDLL